MGQVHLMHVLGNAYYNSPDEINYKINEVFFWVGVWEDEPQVIKYGDKDKLVVDAIKTARTLVLQEGFGKTRVSAALLVAGGILIMNLPA